METRPHSPDRTASRCRSLLVRQFLQIAQHDGFAIHDRQLSERQPKRRQFLRSRQALGGIENDSRLADGRQRLVPPLRESASRVIPRDPQQPGDTGRAGRVIAPRFVDHRHEGVLRNVFRRARHTDHVHREAIDVRPTPVVEGAECLSISSGYRRDQVLVRIGHRSPGMTPDVDIRF